VEGAAQTHQQFAHAARGEPSTEGRLDPLADLSRALEASGGDLAFELIELGRRESARVALVVQAAQQLQAARSKEGEPVRERARADIEEVGHFVGRVTLVQPQQGRQTLVDACISFVAAQFLNLLAHQGGQRKRTANALQNPYNQGVTAMVS
jgi:hypothetical protein